MALEGGADPPVHFGASLQQEILVDHVLQDRLREAVGLRGERGRSRHLLDDLGVAEQLEIGIQPGWIGGRRP